MGYRRSPNWMRSRASPDEPHKDPAVQVWIGSLAVMFAMWGLMFYEGQVLALWNVTSVTAPLYIAAFLVTVFGLTWWHYHETFENFELGFYFMVAVPMVYASTACGYWFLTDLGDIEIHNGHAERFEWSEGYYTESYNSEKKETERTYHQPDYKLYTSNRGEYLTLSASEWSAFVSRWGGQRRVTSSRMILAAGEWTGSDGDGVAEEHTITWDNRVESRVPTAIEHYYVNYVRASDSVLKIHGAMGGYEQYLCDYPRAQNRGFGPIDIDRVIIKGATPPPTFAAVVKKQLDDELCQLASLKQCNVMVYLVGCEDVGFFNALLEKWQLGKKNDIVVVVGCSGSKIGWARVMAWTDHKLFLERLEQRVRDLGDLNGKETQFVTAVVEQIKAPGDAGYLRKPMADFAYLAASVRMPWWAQFLVFMGTCVLMLPTIYLIVRD